MKSLSAWNPEDTTFWEREGKSIAVRNLLISIPNLLLAFSIWMVWSMIIVRIQGLHDANPALFNFTLWNEHPLTGDAYRALLYILPAVAGLSGATTRITNSFIVTSCGGRNVKGITTFLMILPALGTGIALGDPHTPFVIFIVLAALSGIGGGAFASSMSNISFFFPKRMQGLTLGLNAGLGNLGVAVMQLLVPLVITFGIFGDEPYLLGNTSIWLGNAGLVWVPILLFFGILAFIFMNNMAEHHPGNFFRALGNYLWLEIIGFLGAFVGIILLLIPWGGVPELIKIAVIVCASIAATLILLKVCIPKKIKPLVQKQFGIFRDKHNWIMTYLYMMTFGSFIGYSSAFPKLLKDVFGYIRVDAEGNPLSEAIVNPYAPDIFSYVFLGAALGAAIRPIGGWLSDKCGGARVTHWDTMVMIIATCFVGYCVHRAQNSPHPEDYFWPFLGLFILLFVTTGIGNGSTFRMIAVIFSKEERGSVLGWTSAVAAFGSFLIPIVFAMQISQGTPEYAFYGFAAYYVSCLILNFWFYHRKNAQMHC